MRTCVSVEEYKREGHPKSYLIFFSLADPPRTIAFKDYIGRQFSFPYEFCKDWEVRTHAPPSPSQTTYAQD